MKAGIYVRCSNEEKDRDTLSTQREDNIKTCEKNGWSYEVMPADDGVSATGKLEGPGFLTLIAKVKSGEINNVVVWKGDRFGRNVLESLLNTEKYLKPYGCKITIAGRTLDLENPDDYFQFVIDQAFSTKDAQNIKRTTSRTKNKRIEEHMVTQGKLPYGYRWVTPKVARVTGEAVGSYEVKDEADNVRRVFELFLQGHNQSEIARMIPGFNQSKVSLILRRDCYWTGKYRNRYGGKVGTVDVDILIDPEVAEGVQKKLERNPNYGRPKFPHLLKGRLVCVKCGSTSQIRNTTIKGKLYPYYFHRCKNGGVNLPAELWDQLFWNRIVYAVDHPQQFARSIQALQGSEYEEQIKTLNQTCEGYLRERESRNRKKQNLIDQIEDATNPTVRKDLMGRLESHIKEIDSLDFQLKRIDQKIKNLKRRKQAATKESLVAKIKSLKLRNEMPYKEKRQALEKLETVVYFMPMKPCGMVRTTTSVWHENGFSPELVRQLKGIPLRAEGLLEIDFNENIDSL